MYTLTCTGNDLFLQAGNNSPQDPAHSSLMLPTAKESPPLDQGAFWPSGLSHRGATVILSVLLGMSSTDQNIEFPLPDLYLTKLTQHNLKVQFTHIKKNLFPLSVFFP